MSFKLSRQRIYASLLILGASILLFRTIVMVVQGYLAIFVFWVSALLIAEMLVDAACLGTSIRWWIANDKKYDSLPLRFGATAALVHAIRVLVFVLGRVGPWIDFDVRPAHRAAYAARLVPWHLYFAGTLAVLGVISVFIIWILRRQMKK